eukprot:TRINITY_DN1214_c0_g1_i1.p1 TRINITY_DN1214_c0_g1~~TRINITY_DN1214_c0_g1_i1.p1  ORF type:complete len:205 (-),score=36.23 TRINITY_DN1214_c0_g1_i1:284-898(-)
MDAHHKIVVVGNENVGKTSITLRFVDNTFFENTAVTVPFDMKEKKVTIGKRTETLIICDTAGQERFGTITTSVTRNAKGIAYVFDLSNEGSFKSIPTWIKEVTNADTVNAANSVLVGHKCDLPSVVSDEAISKFCEQNNMTYIKASALTGEGISTIFETLAKGCMDDAQGTSSASTRVSTKTPPSKPQQPEAPPKKKKAGCTIL